MLQLSGRAETKIQAERFFPCRVKSALPTARGPALLGVHPEGGLQDRRGRAGCTHFPSAPPSLAERTLGRRPGLLQGRTAHPGRSAIWPGSGAAYLRFSSSVSPFSSQRFALEVPTSFACPGENSAAGCCVQWPRREQLEPASRSEAPRWTSQAATKPTTKPANKPATKPANNPTNKPTNPPRGSPGPSAARQAASSRFRRRR